MSSMLFLVVIVVLVSGLIAYIGDLVGRKMGRKRLTLFGLRPRHTAIVISVAAGMLIAAVSLAATFAVDKGVRDLLLTPLENLKADLVTQKAAVSDTRRELDAARRETMAATTQLAHKTQALDATNTHLLATDQRLQRLLMQRQRIMRELDSAQGELTQVQQRLQQSQHALHLNQQQLRNVRSDLATTRGGLDTSKALLISLAKRKKALDDQQLALEQQLVELGDQINILSPLAAGSFAPLAFASQQEILTGLFSTTGSEPVREALLEKFFIAADRVVRRQCPQLPKDVTALIFLGGPNSHPVRISEKQAIHLLANHIGQITATDQAILRLAPVNNVPVNGQALIAVNQPELLMPNYHAYIAGNKVAQIEITVTGSMATGEILGRLVDDLLRDRLPAALRAKEMLPVSRRFDAVHPDAVPEATFSMVSWSDLLTAAEHVRALRGKVSVIARSHGSVDRYGPLQIDLEVEPAREP